MTAEQVIINQIVDISNSLKEISKGINSSAPWWSVAATAVLGILAIFGEQIRSTIFKPNLQPADEPIKTKQLVPIQENDGGLYHRGFIFHRLPIKNIGGASCSNVRVLLTYLGPVQNFIPVPLGWTHQSGSSRNISRNETAYLDILKKQEGNNEYQFCWSPEAGVPVEPILRDFDPRKGNLRLEFFEQNGKVGSVDLQYIAKDDKLRFL